MTVAFHTLGCKVNQCDTEALVGALRGRDIETVGFGQFADVYVVNTCTVTHVSDRKSRQMIRRVRKINPAALVAVCGCMTKKWDEGLPGELGVDFVFDAREPEGFFSWVGGVSGFIGDGLSHGIAGQVRNDGIQESQELIKPSRTRAFIKIQDGCDRFCSYCIVPYVRGKLTSYPVSEIIDQARVLVEKGTKEIVLTGIQAASYGDDISAEEGGVSLAALISRLSKVLAPEGLKRLRLSSIDPWGVTDFFLESVARSSILCDHFHLSLQSGCDRTLLDMNRRYTGLEYAKTAESLLKLRPEAALTTDIIVGFPGESDADFCESMDFVRKMGFARVHVFEYSPREGTAATKMPGKVPQDVKSRRGSAMRELADECQRNFLQAQIGKTLSVLIESKLDVESETKRESVYIGHTENYCPVKVISDRDLVNHIVETKIITLEDKVLTGHIGRK